MLKQLRSGDEPVARLKSSGNREGVAARDDLAVPMPYVKRGALTRAGLIAVAAVNLYGSYLKFADSS